ncbi:insulinase family protein [Alphaproteobacteria bacterium]|nr:insulinase family protein [Alphaproteobacteria bacterium]
MTDPEITILQNGIRVVSEHHSHLHTTAVGIWVNVGSRNESSNLNGISHLLEHMAFKGTSSRSALDIVNQIESVGGHLNAYTSRENTAYYARILKDDIELAVDILSDIIKNSTFQESELNKEISVIEQEIAQCNDTPDDIIFDHFQHTAFPEQSLGRPILGKMKVLNSLDRKKIITYMKQEYTPERIVISASGYIKHDLLVSLINDRLNNISSKPSSNFQPGKYFGGDYREVKELEQSHILIGFPGVSYGDIDYYTSQLFSIILGGGMSSWLFQEIRENLGLCYSISAFSTSYTDTGLVGIYTGTSKENINRIFPAISSLVVRMKEKVTNEELNKAKSQLKASLMMSLESSSSRCENFARQLLIFDKLISTNEIISKIDSINIKMIKNFSENMLKSKRLTLAAIGPVSSMDEYSNISEMFF